MVKNMPVITFIKPDGSEHQIETRQDASLMEVGRDSEYGY